MKKSFAIFLLFSYLFTLGGVALNFHYCGGELSSVSMLWSKKKSCGCGSSKMAKDCCKDKQLVFKVKDSHKSTTFLCDFKASFSFSPAILPAIFQVDFYTPVTQSIGFVYANAPPNIASRCIYILNCVFRI